MADVLDEFLVRIGANVDTASFNKAMTTINKLGDVMGKLRGAAQIMAVAKAFQMVGDICKSLITDVANADMQFTKLAASMWTTKETAKSLSTAMKVMGASEKDIAWIPELREQFFRLRNTMNELATPSDAEGQLKWIREIGYDVQELQVKFKALKEWIAYYLIKYLEPYLKDFKEFINWLSDQLGKRMPEIAKKIAWALSTVVSIGSAAFRAIKGIAKSIYEFVDKLPANVKKWGMVFAAVGAAIMTGPFGLMIAAIGGALVLLQDFMYYMEGKRSSKTLAPIWEKFLRFFESGAVSEFMQTVQKGLSWCADTLDSICRELKGWWGLAYRAFKDIEKSVDNISKSEAWKSLKDTADRHLPKIEALFRSVWQIVVRIYDCLKGMYDIYAKPILTILENCVAYLMQVVSLILDAIDWDTVSADWLDGLNRIAGGFLEILDAVANLIIKTGEYFGLLEEKTGADKALRQKTFWDGIGKSIGYALEKLGQFGGLIGTVLKALGKLIDGDFKGAAATMAAGWEEYKNKGARSMYKAFGTGPMADMVQDEKGNAELIYHALKAEGRSDAGIAAALGNLTAESHIDPTSVEVGSVASKTGYRGAGFRTKEDYLKAIQNGSHDWVNDEIGFGIAQWTDAGRKQALWDFTGGDIFNINKQIAFLIKELKEQYGEVWDTMEGNDFDKANRLYMTRFEAPADQSAEAIAGRGAVGEAWMVPMSGWGSRKVSPYINPNSYAGGYGLDGYKQGEYKFSVPNSPPVKNFNTTVNVNVASANATPGEIGSGVVNALDAHQRAGWGL